ncbi:hypothetical protein HRbin28_00279 [bacterium HR28]|nr:hypothetical protein HRbin28_00279 [bacterium HR28]
MIDLPRFKVTVFDFESTAFAGVLCDTQEEAFAYAEEYIRAAAAQLDLTFEAVGVGTWIGYDRSGAPRVGVAVTARDVPLP